MKQRAAYTLLLAAAAFLSSCLNTPEVVEPMEQTEILSLSEDEVVAAARAHYERYKQSTRVVGGDGEQAQWPWQAKPHAPYDLGEYEIDWSSAYTKYQYNPPRVHTDFDIIKENDFIYFPNTSNHYSGMKLRSRFVSVQTPDTIVQYIATYIPHVSYYDRYYSVRHGGGRIGLMEVNFSGNVLCTTLDGYHYAVYRVRQGEVVSESNLYANFPLREWSYETFFIIMQDFHIGVCKLSEEVTDTSTLTEDDVANTILIEEISIVAPRPKLRVVYYGTIYKYTPDWSTVSSYVKFYKHPGTGGGGGSATEGTLPDSGETPPDVTAPTIDGKTPEEVSEDIFNNYGNLADSVKTKVNTMIAEIAEDCMGKELLSQLMGRNVTFEFSATAPRSRFFYDENKVLMKNNLSEGLLHELFHAYQKIIMCNNVGGVFYQSLENFEAEAYIAMYLYMDRCLSLEMYSRQKRFSKRNPIGMDASKAAKYLTYKGYMNEWNMESENKFSNYFKNIGRNAVSSSTSLFDAEKSIDENLSGLQSLSQNCDDL